MISYKNYAEKVEESEKYSKEANVLEKENARLKELNRVMGYIIREWVEMRVDSKLVSDARNVLAKVEGEVGE